MLAGRRHARLRQASEPPERPPIRLADRLLLRREGQSVLRAEHRQRRHRALRPDAPRLDPAR